MLLLAEVTLMRTRGKKKKEAFKRDYNNANI